MAMHSQILWGSFYLGLCCVLHVGFLTTTIRGLRGFVEAPQERHALLRLVLILLGLFLAIVFSHTVQVWLWAWALVGIEQLRDWNNAIYFSLVTYTTLGYGDIVLGPGARIFGSFAAVTGLLSFGLSTAILVAVLSRLLRNWFV